MKKKHSLNYLILAHKDPKHLEKLIIALQDEDARFYIHLDSKSELNSFSFLTKKYKNLHFIPNRENCIWGDYSIVQATSNLIEVLENLDESGHCILLSGQDYPIKSKGHIKSFLAENENTDFIQINPVQEVWPNHWYKRLNYYRYNFSEKKGDYLLIPPIKNRMFWFHLPKVLSKIVCSGNIIFNVRKLAYLLLKQRNKEGVFKFYGGSQWWALTNKTIADLKNFIHQSSYYCDFHKFTHAADEIFFQTAITQLQNQKTILIDNQSTTYTYWPPPPVTSPKTLDEQDLRLLLEQGAAKLFARKFETNVSSRLIEMLIQSNNVS